MTHKHINSPFLKKMGCFLSVFGRNRKRATNTCCCSSPAEKPRRTPRNFQTYKSPNLGQVSRERSDDENPESTVPAQFVRKREPVFWTRVNAQNFERDEERTSRQRGRDNSVWTAGGTWRCPKLPFQIYDFIRLCLWNFLSSFANNLYGSKFDPHHLESRKL